MGDEDLADIMIHLQKIGCHNINLVTPTHVMPTLSMPRGWPLKKGSVFPFSTIPAAMSVLRPEDLRGIVDIYKPDFKYMDPEKAGKILLRRFRLPRSGQEGGARMNRQVGVLRSNEEGFATRGLLIRHLVMPNRIADTEKFVKWVAENLPNPPM